MCGNKSLIIKNKLYFKVVLLITVLLFNTYNVSCQIDEARSLKSWVVISGNHKIAEKWSVPTVGVLRHHDLFTQYEFAFVRSGITYHFNKSSMLTIGAAYLDKKGYEDPKIIVPNTQFWIYEQFSIKSTFNTFSISNRIRFETRWINKQGNQKLNNRIRYRLQFTNPVYKNFYIKSFNEIFFNIDSPLFNQNRFFVGFGTPINKNLKIEAGYLKNHFIKKHTNRLRIAVLFKTNLFRSNKK